MKLKDSDTYKFAPLSNDDLKAAFDRAESEGDDITCLAILDEKARRGLRIMDK